VVNTSFSGTLQRPDLHGAEEHCQIGNLSRMHQVAFDWLDEVFEVAGRSGGPPVDPLAARATNMREVVQS
jgi:hypothetical protein